MNPIENFPVAVQNLRNIWNKKKVEMQFTQVEAAQILGWSQGAISHYLNNITELGPAAVVKFANFLSVDPLDIDPSVEGFLPNIRTRLIKYDASNLSTAMNEKFYDKNPESAFWVGLKVNPEPTSQETRKDQSEAPRGIKESVQLRASWGLGFSWCNSKDKKKLNFFECMRFQRQKASEKNTLHWSLIPTFSEPNAHLGYPVIISIITFSNKKCKTRINNKLA